MIPKQHKSIYQQRQDIGSLYVRTNINSIETGENALSGIYPMFESIPADPSIADQLKTQIRDFDIFYDTLMVFVPTHVMFAKINYDFSTGEISSDLSNVRYITLDVADTNIKFGGTWFHEKEKTVVACMVVSCYDEKIFPVLYQLDLDTNELTYLYNSHEHSTALSSLNICSFEEPVFTYNKYLQLYNISFIIKSPDFINNVFGVVQYNIKAERGAFKILNINVVKPD